MLLLSGLLVGPPLPAQDTAYLYRRSALIKTNLTGPFSLFVEVPTTPRQSVRFSVQRINLGLFDTFRIFSITPEYRFYLSKQQPSARRPAPKGFYVGPYLKYRSIVEERIGVLSVNKYATVFYAMFGGGAVAGTQFISRGGFVFDAFLGAGYFLLMKYEVTVDKPGYTQPKAKPEDYRLNLRVGLCIGLAFVRPRALATEFPGQPKP